MNNIKHHLLVLLATTLVAGSFWASEKLAGVINPISLTLLRFIGASLILLPIVLAKEKWRSKVLSTLPRAIIISLFYTVFFIGFFEALNTTSATNTATIFTLVPLITGLLSIIAFRERLTGKQLLVYAIGAAGTIWVIFGGQLTQLLAFTLSRGDLIFFAAIFFMSFYSIAMKMLYRNDEMIVLAFCTLIGGSCWMALTLLITGQPLEWQLLEHDAIFHMAYLILGATLATVFLYQITTVALGPKRVNAYIYLNPALVVLLLLIIEDIPIPNAIIPGILMSVIATVILQRSKHRS